ncbi:MAG: ATP-binding protein [Frankiaceae bacterium]
MRGGGRGRRVAVGLGSRRSLVAAHGGTVSVSTEPGGGACFTVRLPRRGEEAVDRPVACLSGPGPFQSGGSEPGLPEVGLPGVGALS